MALDTLINGGSNTAGKANVTANYELSVALTTTATNAGFAKLTGNDGDPVKVLATGYPAISIESLQFYDTIDGTNVNTNLWLQSTSTMTVTQAGGFLNLNPTNSLTANAYAINQTIDNFFVTGCLPLHCHFDMQSSLWNLPTNTVMEIGWGTVATNAAPTDGVFVRAIGGTALLVANNGGTETTAAFTLPTLNITSEFVLDIYADKARLYQDGVKVAEVVRPTSQPALTSANRQPFFQRVYNTATPPASSPTLKLGQISIQLRNANLHKPMNVKMTGMGRGCYQSPSAFTQLPNWTNNSAPSTRSLANATPCETTLGGLLRFTPTTTVDNDYPLFAYTVPAGFQLFIKNVWLTGPMYISGTAAATSFVGTLGIGLNCSADSLATSDSAGTWAPRKVALAYVFLVASPTAASVPTMFPASAFDFDYNAVVDGGRRLHIILRSLLTRSAGASEVFHFSCGISGYFE